MKTMKPTLSIIVPCYNQAEYLPETLDSVLKQTFQEWECIVVNDGSPDNTSEVANRYVELDSRFKLVDSENKGLSGARNTGIRASSGQFILPLDSDDLILPQYAQLAMEWFERFPETKLVYCQAKKFGVENKFWELPDYSWDKFIFNNSIFCSCVYRRSDYDKTSGYNESMKVGFEDWDFLLNLLNKEDVVYQIPEVLFLYRVKHVSMTSSDVSANKEALAWQIIDNHKDIYREYLFNRMAVINHEKVNNTAKLEMAVGHAVTKPYRIIRNLLLKFK